MNRAALVGLLVTLAVAVVAFAIDLVIAGYAAVGAGGLWLALADGQTRTIRWAPAMIEHDRRAPRG